MNEFQGPPAVNFYGMLSGLGDTIAANRAAQAKKDAFTAATTPGPDGKIDYGRAILGLAQVDPQAAAVIAADRNHNDTLAHQTIEDARNAKNDTFSQGMQSANLKIAQANLANNSEGPEEEAQQRSAAAASYGLKPGTPEFQTYALTGKLPDSIANGGQPEVGLNPAYGTMGDGKVGAIQFSKTGKAVQTQLPEGFSLSKEPIRVDSGTHITLVDPITRQTVGIIPKDLAGAEKAKEEGSAAGIANAGLPQALATAQQGLKTIDELKNHPGLDHSVGMWSMVPNIPGSAGADFNAKANQLKGQTFLQAYTTLRGSGAITDIEGKKGEDAIAALDRSQSKPQYLKALNDLATVIQGGMLRAKAKAAGPSVQQYPAASPGAVALLKKNGDFQAYDEIFGPGAAKQALSGGN